MSKIRIFFWFNFATTLLENSFESSWNSAYQEKEILYLPGLELRE